MYSSNSSKTTALFLTFLFPFAGLVYTLSHWRESWAKNAFWLACIYLGVVFIYWPEGSVLGLGADGGRYALDLINCHNDNSSFLSILARYRVERNSLDFYQPIVTYLISRFTDNGHVLFAVFAFVFGFFYSRNIWYILDRLPRRKLGWISIMVMLFFLICPITQINGVRMWTALHVFVYAMMPYLVDKDKSKLWWLVAVPFIHFSYLYVVLLAVIYVFIIPDSSKTYSIFFLIFTLIVFIVSLFINSINLSSVNSVLQEYSPETFEERIDMYVDEDVVARIAEANALTNWYVGASGIIKSWVYSILLILLFSCYKRNFQRLQVGRLYSFSLLFGAFANIMAMIPSGGRFQLVSQMFTVALIILVAMSILPKDPFNRFLSVAMIFLLIPLIVDFRKLLDFYGITAIAGNFITALFWENNVPLIDFIKQLL